MRDHPSEPAYCTTREAALQLGVSVGTVQSWVECGRLEAWKTTGGHRRVLRDSVDKLLRRPPARAPAALPQPPSVVVVEDDAGLLQLYQAEMALWPQAPQVHGFDSAVQALLHIGRRPTDLLILDLHMPGMDGFRLLRSLLGSPEVGHTTLAVVTGLQPADIASQGGLPEGVHLFGKPIPFGALAGLWTSVLARRGAGLAAAAGAQP